MFFMLLTIYLRRKIKLISLGLLLLNQSFATPQIKDILYIGKDTFAIPNLPLESYLDSQKISLSNFCSTDCWRGYYAFWKIENDSLSLVGIRNGCNGAVIDFQTIFPNSLTNAPIFADWVTDIFTIPVGKKLKCIHIGYGHETERDYTVTNGIVTVQQMYSLLTIQQEHYLLDSLNTFLLKHIQWQNLPINNQFVVVNIGIFMDNQGRIIDKVYVNSENVFYKYEALRLTDLIQKLPIHIQKPNILQTYFVLPIRFPPKP